MTVLPFINEPVTLPFKGHVLYLFDFCICCPSTVPLKGELPSSRETHLNSLEARLVSLETCLISLETCLISLETCLVSLETSLVSLEYTVSAIQRLPVLVYSSYCVFTHRMKACFGVSYQRLICSVGVENGHMTFIHE